MTAIKIPTKLTIIHGCYVRQHNSVNHNTALSYPTSKTAYQFNTHSNSTTQTVASLSCSSSTAGLDLWQLCQLLQQLHYLLYKLELLQAGDFPLVDDYWCAVGAPALWLWQQWEGSTSPIIKFATKSTCSKAAVSVHLQMYESFHSLYIAHPFHHYNNEWYVASSPKTWKV